MLKVGDKIIIKILSEEEYYKYYKSKSKDYYEYYLKARLPHILKYNNLTIFHIEEKNNRNFNIGIINHDISEIICSFCEEELIPIVKFKINKLIEEIKNEI